MRFFLALLLCVFTTPALAKKQKTEIQLEARFDLTEAAAKAVLRKYTFESKMRSDYYFEIFDGSHFLLGESPKEYKYRLQVYESKSRLQTAEKISRSERTCRNGARLTFSLKERRVGELKVGDGTRDRIVSAAKGLLRSADDGEPYALVGHVHDLHGLLADAKVPFLQDLISVAPRGKWYFVASHSSDRVKYKAELDFGQGELEVSVGAVDEYSGRTMVQSKYEVEFQPPEGMDRDALTKSICAFAKEMDFSPDDVSPDLKDPRDVTKRRLTRFAKELGL